MEVTEVRIKLINNPADRLRGFCSVTFDNCFVVRDLKIIEGDTGPFVAMPSRKLTDNCRRCRAKNHLRANFCNQCGGILEHGRLEYDAGGRAKLYADVAHPVNASCREMIQRRVAEELKKEVELSSQPGYKPRYDSEYFDTTHDPTDDSEAPSLSSETPVQASIKPVEVVGESSSGDLPPQIRIDSDGEKPYKTHKPNDDLSEETKSRQEDFGKGVFE